MSLAELTNDTRPVLEQVGERAAEQSPAWGVPRLGMTAQMLLQQEDARRRLHDSRILECRALGLPDPGEFEPMGPITVEGDTTTVNHNYPPPAATPTPTVTPAPQPTVTTTPTPSPLRKFIWPVILGAVLPICGAGAMAIYNYFTDKPNTVASTPDGRLDYQYRIEVRDRP